MNSNKSMANAFNDFFTNIGPKLDEDIPICNKPGGMTYYLNGRNPYSFLISPTNTQEISDIMTNIDGSKSSGPCSVPTKMLKLVVKEISIPFNDIRLTSFSEGIFPDENKLAKVIPSYKKGSIKDVNNYHPISLLSIFSKIMEKIMSTRLTNYLELHDIIYPKQFGFRAGFSTTHSLISITETIKKTLDEKKYGCSVFIDLKKAFDTVDHDILLYKLEHYEIRGASLLWFKSYLYERKQFVHRNGIDSEVKTITCGVPQGSVLGPLLFLLNINDLPNISKELKFYLFADDTSIFLESNDLKSLEKTMNKELLKLYEWLCINRLALNITKTNFVIFHAKNKTKSPVTILINNKAIDEDEEVIYLGIIIDSKLTFKNHINELKKRFQDQLESYINFDPLLQAKSSLVFTMQSSTHFFFTELQYGEMQEKISLHRYSLNKINLFVWQLITIVFLESPGALVKALPLFHRLKILTIFDIYNLQVGKLVFESINEIGPTVYY